MYSFRIGSSLNSFVTMEKFSVRTEKFFLLPPLLSFVFLVWVCSFVWLSDLQFAGMYVLLRIDSSLNSGEEYGEVLNSDGLTRVCCCDVMEEAGGIADLWDGATGDGV